MAAEFDDIKPKFDNLFIGIAGLIGAGKSTLATELGKYVRSLTLEDLTTPVLFVLWSTMANMCTIRYEFLVSVLGDDLQTGLPTYFEPVGDNVYLEDFYRDMKATAFAMQVWLLSARFRQHQSIVWSTKGAVQDRTIFEDSIFARVLADAGFMSQKDYQTYIKLFNDMSNFMRKPNLIVYLHVTPEESMERIRSRGRDCESGITLEYLQSLYDAYEAFIMDISRTIPVIKVDYRRFQTADVMARAIAHEYAHIHNIRHVTFEALESLGVRGSAESKSPEAVGLRTKSRVATEECASGGAQKGDVEGEEEEDSADPCGL